MAPRSIVPGTVVVILSGEQAGERAVFLEAGSNDTMVVCSLKSGVQKVPRRHCIGTSMSFDVSGIKAASAEVSNQVASLVKKDPLVEEYMTTPFSLNSCLNVPPHELKF